MTEILTFVGGTVVCIAIGALIVFVWMIRRSNTEPTRIDVHGVAERVRATGSLVGLEVAAKEIATATKGWGWLPPIVMSQARLAMIFQFEKQYSVDLGQLRAEDVERLGAGRFRITLPEVTGKLRLVDVSPYDIQAGRVLGLLDVIPMSADRQKELMKAAQEQAGELLAASEASYLRQARSSIARQLRALVGLFDLELEIVWRDAPARDYEIRLPPELKPSTPGSPSLSLVAG